MRRGLTLIGLFLALGACGAASGRGPASGITGRVVAGPVCPVETVPSLPRCAPRPLAVTLHVQTAGGHGTTLSVRSGADGRFRLRLAPGTYRLRALAPAGSPLPRPPPEIQVKVRPGRYTFVGVRYDSGIR